MRRISTRHLWLVTLLVLLIAASRFIRINDFHLDNDEIWSIWQTMGTPAQILQWTSPTEHPAYFLLLDAWKHLVGMDPFVLRYFSLLLCLPGVVFMYRALRRQHGHTAGVIASLAYYAFAISQFTSLYARSYVFAFSVLPLTLWLIQRYFDKPSLFLRAVPLALSLVILYISTVTIVPAFFLFGLYTLLVYRQRIWRWWLPVLILFGLVLPDIITNKLQQVSNHTNAVRMFMLPPLPTAVLELYTFLTGSWLWFVVLGFTLLVLVVFWRRTTVQPRLVIHLAFWFLWVIGVPILLYILEPRLGFYALKRYGWWYVFGLAVFMALVLVRLPKVGQWLSVSFLAVLCFLPFRLNDFSYIVTPLGENLRWLTEHLEAGDALLLDSNYTCNFPEEWDYYTQLYFPTGLRFVDSIEDARRVWYVSWQDPESEAFEKSLEQTHISGRFVGPPECLFRLYEAAPDSEGILYPNGMRFHGAEIMNGDKPLSGVPVMREGQPFKVRLWWSVDRPVDLDYSVGLTLSRTEVEGQWDSAPQIVYPVGAPVETSRWETGQIYVEERELQMPYPYTRGGLALSMILYWFGDNQRLIAPGMSADGALFLKRIEMVAW